MPINQLISRHTTPLDAWTGPLPFGFDSGYATEADALVSVTADGTDINSIWAEVAAAIAAWNAERSAITSLLSFATTNSADAIPQSNTPSQFELASEFGEPEAGASKSNYLALGYGFDDFDLAVRSTWKFIRNATAEQVRAQYNYVLEADNRLCNGMILQRLFDNTPDVNEFNTTIYSLYNGDALVPPDYLGRSFATAHQHYLVSGNTTIDSGDVETLLKNVTEHGFNEAGSQLLLFVNPEEGEVISTFKAGVANQNSQVAKHDYIPSAGAPAYLQPENIVGQVAPGEFNGLKVAGSYGPLWVIWSDYVPAKYAAVVSTYGKNSPNNVIGFREHVQPQYRGLRLIGGKTPGYPLVESFAARSAGVGVRRRGQAAVLQVKASGSYDIPLIAV